MSAEPQHHWIRIELRPARAIHDVLTQHVYPYVQTVLETGMADSFSFFRGTAERPGIVLYFKGQPDVLQHMLLPNCLDHFARPLQRRAVTGRAYFPDAGRYGGPTGHFLSMLQYRAASEMVLEQLHRHRAYWTPVRALEIARRLHLSLFYRIHLPATAAATFFERLYGHHGHLHGAPAGIGTRYAEQRAQVLEADRHWWTQLHHSPPTDAHWRRWDSMQQIIGNSLERALVQGKLRDRPATELLRGHRKDNHDRAQLWSYYADFVRLTNNRLGLSPTDESYCYYSLARSLRHLEATALPVAPSIGG